MTAEQWKTVDITVCAEGTYNNPFLDVDVTGTFTHVDGTRIKLLGFWDGGNQWVVRFAPTLPGEWHYIISSTNPDDEGLRLEGTVTCVPYEGELAIYRHGFLKVGPQGRYLTYNDGTPFFWLGDTHWRFVTDERFDESNCPEYESQFKACVDKRIRQKFTVYQCNFRDGVASERPMPWKTIPYLINTEAGYLPDIEFFHNNPDPKMQYLADAGLVIAVGYAWVQDMLSEDAENRYKLLAKYLAARYGAYPVIWTLAGEIPAYEESDYQQMLTDKWRVVALEAEKWSGYHNLQSAHQAADRPFKDIYQGESWYDFAMTQAGHGDLPMSGRMYSDFKEKNPACPMVESEGLYEAAYSGEFVPRQITPEMMRRLAYLCIQNGGCGYTYGVNGIWELSWEASPQKRGMGGGVQWWEALDLPGADQLTYMRDFYEGVHWESLRPINHVVEAGMYFENEELRQRVKPCFTADNEMKTIVGYFPPTSLKMFTISTLPWKSYTAKWFDPGTGEYTLIDDDIRPTDGKWSLRIPYGSDVLSGSDDKVLLVTCNE